MKTIHKLTFSVLLIAIGTGVFIFMNRSAVSTSTVGREASVSRSTVDSNDQIIPVNNNPVNVLGQSHGEDGKTAVKKVSTSNPVALNPVALILSSEKPLVTEIEGNQGVDVQGVDARAAAFLMMADKFDEFMEQLSLESSSDPLARDITSLYTHSAAEANLGVDNQININITCGMVVCGVAATAPTKDAFDAWFEAFVGSESAPPYAAGRYDMILDDDSVEYRVIFSTDPQRRTAISPPE